MEKNKIKEIFDRSAATYDKTWEKLAPVNDSLHLLMGAGLSGLPEKARILCVGAGTGAELVYMAKKFPYWTFTAVDPSAAMLDVCRRRLKEMGMEDRCEFYADYLENLSLPNDYEAATSILVSQFITDKKARMGFFQNIAAKLKPGGLLISADLSGDINSCEYEPMLNVWASMMMDGDVQSQSMENIRQTHQSGISFLPPVEVAGMIGAAGFKKPVLFYQMAFIHGWFCRKTHSFIPHGI
ncbi:MAG: class I SAM-dependent methyltransferase [Candidatus Azobacteroides sp.]|nr:class I SAM-dependent methyltransferase [Candidatus Azobacteroides sp.]